MAVGEIVGDENRCRIDPIWRREGDSNPRASYDIMAGFKEVDTSAGIIIASA